MSTRTALRSLGIAVFFLACRDVVWAGHYVVGRAGDRAAYRNMVTGHEIRAEIDQERGSWTHYTEFAGLGPLWVASGSRDERVRVHAPPDRAFQLLTDFGAPIGFTAPLDIGPCNRGAATLAARGRLTVPAGSFSDVVRIDFATSCADGGVTSAWFARGVGTVQWTGATIAGPATYQMISATIAGARYPRPAGVSLFGEFPGPRVWINLMPPAPPPAAVEVYLTVQNDTAEPLAYSFATGQLFEIEVIDSAGGIVSRWSRGKAFTQAFHDVTVAPGESRRFGGAVVLADDDSRPLAQGPYTLRIYLTSMHPPGVSPPLSSAPVEIGWAL